MINIITHITAHPVDTRWVEAVLQELLTQTDYQGFDVGVLFTDDELMAKYNHEYRSKQGPTDILSFSYYPQTQPGQKIEPQDEEERILGDLVLAPDYIHRTAQTSYEQRLLELLIHGYCHLLGYDHEKDEDYRLMHEMETQLIQGLPASLRR